MERRDCGRSFGATSVLTTPHACCAVGACLVSPRRSIGSVGRAFVSACLNGGGSIATAGGLIFIGATNDKRFRAFESRTGKMLWETRMEYDATATPLTYQGKSGKQYVAVSVGNALASSSLNRLAEELRPGSASNVFVFALP